MVAPPSLFRSLTLRYVLALALVGSLATTAFLFLHKVILRHENEAAVVNLSGRQRMLSQRITLAASLAMDSADPARRRFWLDELTAAASLMERSHEALTKGDPDLEIPADLAASIGPLYAARPDEVSRQVAEFLADARALAASDGPIDPADPAYQRILARSSQVLSGLDDVVSRYQAEVEQRVRTLEQLETGVWLVTLVVLTLEALFIFRPMTRRVQSLLQREAERREAAEQQSIDDQRRAETLVDTIADAVVTIDQDGLIRTFSPSAERMFGWSRTEMLGREVGDLMPDSYQRRHKDILRHYMGGGAPRVIGVGLEVEGRHRDGSTFPLELALGEWQSEGRRFFTAVMRDVTQRKALEESVRRAQKMEVVGQLAGGIAHDFNNLLGIISGNLEMLEERLKDNPALLKRVEVAQHAAARGADLTRKLLSFSGSRTSQPQTVDVNAVIRAGNDLLGRLQTAGIEVDLALEDGLPPVHIDPGEFEDALINLVLNARDAMPGGGTIVIATSVFQPEDASPEVVVSVADTGVGIDFADQKKIFEPFYSSKPPGKGTGLGLVTVDSFVRHSRGRITVYSAPGRGTTFRITLPALAATPTDAPGPVPGGTETLLIVDDEAELKALLCGQLESLGYRCLPAGDADAALAILEERRDIALVITDVIMPGTLDGVDLARRALQSRPGLKVLLMTGFAARSSDDLLRQVPSAGVIAKPYRRRDIAERIRALLDAPSPSPADAPL